MALNPNWKPRFPGDQPPRDYYYIPGSPGDDGVRPPANNGIPASVQTAWNTFNNPPAGTGGLKPTKQMVQQFEQYGLNNSSNSSSTRIGNILPDGSVKGDKNKDGRFGLSDFIRRKKPSPGSTNGAPGSSQAPSLPSEVPNYDSGRKRKPRRQGLLDLRAY